MKGLRLVPEDTNINFVGMRLIAFVISSIIIVGSIATIAQKGLNFGIDFTGGTVIEIITPEVPDLQDLRVELSNVGVGAVSIQEFGEAEDLLVRLPQQEGGAEEQQAAIATVKEALDTYFQDAGEVVYRRTEFVGPQVGEELKKAGLLVRLVPLLKHHYQSEEQFPPIQSAVLQPHFLKSIDPPQPLRCSSSFCRGFRYQQSL